MAERSTPGKPVRYKPSPQGNVAVRKKDTRSFQNPGRQAVAAD